MGFSSSSSRNLHGEVPSLPDVPSLSPVPQEAWE
jgi:hypothetical protein